MDFRLLGPLEVVGDGGLALSIGTGRQRALLALLILRANELVATDRLVEDLWGESPPPTAQNMLHNHVSALRRTLGQNGRLETRGSAYRLNVGPGERDVDRFEELMARGRSELQVDPERAAATLREALELWRGPPLSDLAYEPFAQTEIARLEERRWAAFEARIEAELTLGRHADVVSELEAAVAEQPLRERLHGQLMLALYRCARQAEALEAYRRARRTLVEEIGVEPGTELRALHEAILAQDPALDLPPVPEELPAALEGGSPLLAGRDRELAELLGLLADACEGRGGAVLVSGPSGIGKTRLAAELARDGLRRRMTVLYASARTSPGEALAAVQRAEDRGHPTLLILDEADIASRELLDRAAGLVGDGAAGRRLLLVMLGSGEPPASFATRPPRRIELGPLDHRAVAEIARLYLPGGSEPPAVEALAARSGGVPLAVHRAAQAWVRARAAEEIGASAGRAALEREELRAAEADLSDDLLALRGLDERGRRYAGEHEDVPLPAVCPFPGLATFDAAHAEYFFGRERLVAELVARLVGAPLLAVIGPSGSGKSSAVRAGLLPALGEGVLPGSERWRRALMRPGAHPFAELERTLPEPGERTVLAVDQFEEVFTVCRDEHQRTAFLDALVERAEAGDGQLQVVVAMRADFYGRCALHDRLARLVGANQVLVGPMRRDELRRAIEEPARQVGLRVEPSLTDALIADVLDEPGGLPLLSAALLEQWREREGRWMRRATYERTGGVRGAVGRLAERAYTRLNEPERVAARRILLRLADAGEQGAAFVRRRVPLDELDRDEQTAAALGALVDSRLVTADEETLEVAHEALLREWPRLRAWLEEDAEGRRLHQHLIHAARDWQKSGRDRGELYRGARLTTTLDWAGGHEGELNELEREFLRESRGEAEQESERQRRTNRRLRSLLAGLALLLALAVVAGIVALNQRGEARDAARTADAGRLGVEALNEEQLDRALLLARAGVELDESPATQSNLLSVLLRSPATLGILNQGSIMYAAALSPDGKLMAIGDEHGEVLVYDVATRRRVGRPYRIEAAIIQNVRFSPDGETLAISFFDRAAPEGRNGLVDLIDARSHERRLRLRFPAVRGPAPFVFLDVLFLPNGRDLLARLVPTAAPEALAAPLYRIDGETGALTDRLRVGRRRMAYYASGTADRRRVFVTSLGDNRTWELNAERLHVERSWPVGDWAGVVSPNGRLFALGSEQGGVRLLDLSSGQVRSLKGRHEGPVIRMRFTPDGRTLVTASDTGELYVWDVERGTVAERLAGHGDSIEGLDMTADGRTLITSSVDTRAILWDLGGDRRLDRRFFVARRFDLPFTPRGIAVSPDGRTLAVTHSGGTVDLLDTRTLRPRRALRALDGAAAAVAFSPDGRLLAVTGEGGRLTLWNARTLAPAGELEGLADDSGALAFSPDGTLLAAAEVDLDAGESELREARPLRVWDLRRRSLIGFRGMSSASSIAFSPDGELIAAAAFEKGTHVRDARTGELVKRIETGEFSRAVAFSPDGERLFVGQYDGRGQLLSTDGWERVGRPLEGHSARVTSAEFSRDGRTLVTAAADGTVLLWDAESQEPLGPPLELAPGTYASVALSPDGSRLFAVSPRGEGISFELSREAWKDHACLVAGRELTAGEWEDALPERPQQAVCPD